MKHVGYEYEVSAEITFTKQEVFDLIDVGSSHYDYVCKAACVRAEVVAGRIVPDTGFIYGLKNRLEREEGVFDDFVIASFTARQLGIVCKILEQSALPGQPEGAKDLWLPMRQIAKAVMEEAQRLRGDVQIAWRETVGEIVLSVTTTNGLPLRSHEVVHRVIADPNDLDWLMTEGYINDQSFSGTPQKAIGLIRETLTEG